jgi:hypothetical protein
MHRCCFVELRQDGLCSEAHSSAAFSIERQHTRFCSQSHKALATSQRCTGNGHLHQQTTKACKANSLIMHRGDEKAIELVEVLQRHS